MAQKEEIDNFSKELSRNTALICSKIQEISDFVKNSRNIEVKRQARELSRIVNDSLWIRKVKS